MSSDKLSEKNWKPLLPPEKKEGEEKKRNKYNKNK